MKKYLPKVCAVVLAVSVGMTVFTSCKTQRHTASASVSEVKTETELVASKTVSDTTTFAVDESGWRIEFYFPTDSTGKQPVKSISGYGRIVSAKSGTQTRETAESTAVAESSATVQTESTVKTTQGFSFWWLLAIIPIIAAYFYVKKR